MLRPINSVIDELRQYIENPEIGLPEELFSFITEITPMVNVDLLLRNKEGQYLLAWRIEEKPYPDGWHIPGGIVRVRETLHQRLEKTALKEIGCAVTYKSDPLMRIESVLPAKIRPHFYSYLYDCQVPNDYDVNKQPYKPRENGFLAWHDHCPNDMIPIHIKLYKKLLDDLSSRQS